MKFETWDRNFPGVTETASVGALKVVKMAVGLLTQERSAEQEEVSHFLSQDSP